MRALVVVIAFTLGACASAAKPPSGGAPLGVAPVASPLSQPNASGHRDAPMPQDGPWDLARLLAEAERRNPALVAERGEVDVATAQVWEASLYPNPTLLVQYDEGRWINAPPWQATHQVGVRLPLVVGGRVRAARAAAEADRDVAALRYTWRRREILAAVRTAYADLMGARRRREAALLSLETAQNEVTSVKARLEAQVAPETDVLRANVNLARAEAESAEAAQRVTAAGQVLIAISTIPGLDPERVVGVLPDRFHTLAWSEVAQKVPPLHPLVVIAQREQEAARLRVEEAHALRRADWDLEVKGGVNEDGDGVVSLGLEIPLPIRDNGSARVSVAEARRGVAASRAAAASNEVLAHLSTLYQAVVVAQERVRRYASDVLPPARAALEQTRFGHEKGKFTYFEVLDAQRTLSEATAAYATALSELYKSVAEFESYSGLALAPLPTESK